MKILITAPYHQKAQLNLKRIAEEIIYRPWKNNGRAYSENELIVLLTETKADALITEHDEVSEKLIQLFPHLQFIGVCRGTPSNVDLASATHHGIPVFRTPGRNAQAVAEMFIANVISFMRHTIAGIQWLKEKQWGEGAHASYLQFKGNELAGKTIGLVGFGAIGQLIAQLTECFGCTIQFYDPYVASSNPSYKKTSIEEIFTSSDIVSVHLPVNEFTKEMIDKNWLLKMKPSAIFVNTARASVVKRDDLLQVLNEGLINGAILDVFDHEPPDEKDYQLIHHPRVMATPHIAGATYEVEEHHAEILNEVLIDWFANNRKSGEKLANKELLTVQI